MLYTKAYLALPHMRFLSIVANYCSSRDLPADGLSQFRGIGNGHAQAVALAQDVA
jgi:hypothetical protein